MLLPPPPELLTRSGTAQERLEAWLADDRGQRIVDTPADDRTVVTECGGGSAEYLYDRRGDLAAVVEPDGGRLSFEYDQQRRLRTAHRQGATTAYAYDEDDRLVAVDDEGGRRRYGYDRDGRLSIVRQADGGTLAFDYDDDGRVVRARTPLVDTHHEYDAAGRLVGVRQALDGVELELGLDFDSVGRLAAMRLPGGATVRYGWDERGRPASVTVDDDRLAGFAYDDERRETVVTYANGLVERTRADAVDARLAERELRRGDEVLFARRHRHDAAGRIVDDGARRYAYDDLGRLAFAVDHDGARAWGYRYDARDNLVASEEPGGRRAWAHDEDVLLGAAGEAPARYEHDGPGRRTHAAEPDGAATFRYTAAGDLSEVLRDGARVAVLLYDHKSRLVAVRRPGDEAERYLYGPDDELLAVTDAAGRPLRLIVRTPLGPLAEIRYRAGRAAVAFLHLDHQGTCHLVSDAAGAVAGSWGFSPFGTPDGDGPTPARFAGREWHADLGLYRFGARWYEPRSARFLTPDTFTGAPDDERLVHPLLRGCDQPAARAEVLGAWLQRPRIRNRFAFCANDPVNRVDPNGHWAFGAALMTLLGAVWALPNTIFGLILEVTCLIGEVVRWVVSALSSSAPTWESPGFDVASSPRLTAFALVFSGGWLGSFASVPALTFGNVFFVYKNWQTLPEFAAGDVVHPPAYDGKVAIPRRDTLYEHELFHTKQYGQFGPFFHLGLPLFGVYEWDLLLNGGTAGAVLEKDAYDHSGRTPPNGPGAAGTPSSPARPRIPPPRTGVGQGQQYGNYDLARGDGDAKVFYAGQARTAGGGDRLPAAGETSYVRALQEDLVTLGFTVVGAVDGSFSRRTSWAVRELQAAAKMAHVAVESQATDRPYPDRLDPVANPTPYTGPVSGVVNAATRTLIGQWLAAAWRCPVVVSARALTGDAPAGIFAGGENVWAADDVTASTPRMFARDLSGYYTLPATRTDGAAAALGSFRGAAAANPGGPSVQAPQETWAEAEILPANLVDPTMTFPAALNGHQRSTYKVLRAVSELAGQGFFDGIDASGDGFVALGPAGWTVGVAGATGALPGTFGAYLAYLRQVAPDAFTAAFEFFGVRPDADWQDAAGAPARFDPARRVYAGWFSLQNEDGSFTPADRVAAEADWFRSWHWVYRLAMAGRTLADYRLRMWPMARIHLRELLATPWDPAAGVADVGAAKATIGDVFTSERAVGIVLAWHALRPADIAAASVAGPRLQAVLTRAQLAAPIDPAKLADADDAKLVQALLDEGAAAGVGDLAAVADWPRWAAAGAPNPRGYALDPAIGPLDAHAHSFVLDTADLPAAPAGA